VAVVATLRDGSGGAEQSVVVRWTGRCNRAGGRRTRFDGGVANEL
jgi:hypothetical protein